MFVGSLLLACSDDARLALADEPQAAPSSEMGEEKLVERFTFLAPSTGFTLPEGSPLEARLAPLVADTSVRWSVNGEILDACPTPDDPTACVVEGLSAGDVELCVSSAGAASACVTGSILACAETLWYPDGDGDGYGAAVGAVSGCEAPPGAVRRTGDCDDGDPTAYPGGREICDGRDDDCDGVVDDDAEGATTWYLDVDGDGRGRATEHIRACVTPPGYAALGDDCDDGDASVAPHLAELCNARDDDCDGLVDEGALDAPTWYGDADADGYGDVTAPSVSCVALPGTVADATDCDDTAAAVRPGAPETCNGIDDDCDGDADEPDAIDATTWYGDGDGDGYGDATTATVACEAPAGWIADATDCDDATAAVRPGADETCNGVDDDCDGDTDEPDAIDATTWYADGDGDGYGDAATGTVACDLPPGFSADATDCDDADATANPGAEERLDGVDDDCDGTPDDVAGPWTTDLVVNGSFETGDLTGWTLERGPCDVVGVGDLDWATPYDGDYMLHGGLAASDDCLVSQPIDLVAMGFDAADLDSGRAGLDAFGAVAHEQNAAWWVNVSAYDRTLLRVRYLDDTGAELGSVRTLLSEDDAWALRGTSGLLPSGTRHLSVEVEGKLRIGTDIDSVADYVSVSVTTETPAAPTITKLPFLQDYRQDAMRLLWETDANLADHRVEWSADGGATTDLVTLIDTVQVDESHFVHVATIEGLSAGTEYSYRVGSGDTWSDTYTFRTAPVAGEPFTISWVGDNEWATGVFTTFLERMLDHDVDMYISPGDIVWNGDDVDDWHDEWFAPLETSNFSQTRPVLFARGNHDDHHALSYAYSALPGNEDWYAFTYGNVYFVVLDSNSPTDDSNTQLSQMLFLEEALTSDEALLADFRVVTFHNPPYTNARHDDMQVGWFDAQNDWVPLFEDYNADLVIGGHFHSYQRGTYNDVTYLVVGGGGGYLDDRLLDVYDFFEVREAVYHYALMAVDGATLTWTVYDEDEAEIDQFTLTAE